MAKRAETNVGQWLEAILTRREDLARAISPRLKTGQQDTVANYEVLRSASQLLIQRRFAPGQDPVEIAATIAGIQAVPGVMSGDIARTEEILHFDLGLNPTFVDEYSQMNWRCRSMLALWTCGFMHMSDAEVSQVVVNAEKLAREAGAQPSLADAGRASRLFGALIRKR